MLDLSTLSSLVTTVSVAAGIIFALMQLRHLNRIRKTEIIIKIYDKFSSKEMLEAIAKVRTSTFEDFEGYLKKYGTNDIRQVGLLFEEVGVLLEHGLVDIELVDSLLGQPILSLWDKMRPVIYGFREYIKEPSFLSHAEVLIDRLRLFRNDSTKAL